MALDSRCDACEALRPGGQNVSKASTYKLPAPWKQVTLDVGELVDAKNQRRVKFLVMVDAATKYRKVAILGSYDLKSSMTESADDVIIAAGYRIGPFEVESACLEHEAVREAAAVASPDEIKGNVVKEILT